MIGRGGGKRQGRRGRMIYELVLWGYVIFIVIMLSLTAKRIIELNRLGKEAKRHEQKTKT